MVQAFAGRTSAGGHGHQKRPEMLRRGVIAQRLRRRRPVRERGHIAALDRGQKMVAEGPGKGGGRSALGRAQRVEQGMRERSGGDELDVVRGQPGQGCTERYRARIRAGLICMTGISASGRISAIGIQAP